VEALGVGALGVAAIVGVLTLALKALSAERRAGEQKARADSLDVNLTGLAAQLADMTNRCNEERQRADRLDSAYAKMLADVAAMPATGAFSRLLAIMSAAKTAARDPRELPAPISADAGSDSDLLKPGE